MASIDYEVEYNNRRRVPDYAAYGERFQAASAAYRAEAKGAELDVVYGPRERQRYDFFPAAGASAPVLVYIHGGYWQRGDRKDFSFIARTFNAAGVTVALPSYSLCPAVTVGDIIDELRACVAAVWKRTGRRVVVAGHSAGGHLTAAMTATDWSAIAGMPADAVYGGVSISGVFDLPPLVSTSINDLARMDAASARAASPMFWPPPRGAKAHVAAVGGAESAEFLRQASEIAALWAKAGLRSTELVVEGTNHFSVVEELGKPDSALFKAIAGMALESGGR